MPVPPNHYRVQYTFRLGTGGEIAVTGFHCRYDGGTAPNNGVAAQWLAEHCGAKWLSAFAAMDANNGKNLFPSSLVLDSVKAYEVVQSGPSPNIGAFVYQDSGEFSWKGNNNPSLPWECAVVATLEALPITRPTRPRRYRGRMYLPPMSVSLITGTEGLLSAGAVAGIVANTTALLEGVNDIVAPSGAQARVVVLSRTGGFSTDVTHVSMDNQVDLQRRRQNRQTNIVRTHGGDLEP